MTPRRFADIQEGEAVAVWVSRWRTGSGLWHRGEATWETTAYGRNLAVVLCGGGAIARHLRLRDLQVGDLDFRAPAPGALVGAAT